MITNLSRRGAMIFATAALAASVFVQPAFADKSTEAFVQDECAKRAERFG